MYLKTPVRLPAVLVLVVICYSLAAIAETSKASRFQELLLRYRSSGFLNGVVLVAEHGQIVYAEGFGEADMKAGTSNSRNTKFDIASVTKQFTAALILQQVEEGNLRLDATVSDYLPWYRQDTGKRITIEQLLHHTSGLPADYDEPAFNATAVGAKHFEPREFVEKFCQQKLTSEPGKRWQYSNCGYDLLGLILERVTRVSYGDLLTNKILKPAGMHDSGLDRDGLLLSNRALGYERHAGPTYTRGPHIDMAHVFSAGAMYSTAEDLFRWNQVLSSDALFSKNIRDQIFRPGLANWGYGWFISRIPPGQPGTGNTLAEMRGDLPGNFFCTVMRYPEEDAVIIILRNGYGSSERIESNLQAVLFNQSPRVPWRKPTDVLARLLHSVSGYFHHSYFILVLFAVGIGVLSIVRRRSSSSPVL